MAIHVRIENPPPGGSGETNMNRARRLVRCGRASFTGERSIRLTDAARGGGVAMGLAATQHARLTGNAYDMIERSFFECARNLPMIHPERMIIARRGRGGKNPRTKATPRP
jgi:hypothetical protein